jgi:hypothetical protein
MGRHAALVLAALSSGCVGEIAGVAAVDAPPAALGDAASPADAPRPADGPSARACPRVAHVGDSLTAATVAPLTAAYLAAGSAATLDAYGGRAVLQKLAEDPKTGKQAALDLRAGGFDGCWVVALGTNDTANVAAGAGYTRERSIDEMMAAIDPDRRARVLWVNVFTTRTTGFYANGNMVLYNEALEEARGRWPNLSVLDWAAVAASGEAPFSDGIHHTAAGYAVRNEAITSALARLP